MYDATKDLREGLEKVVVKVGLGMSRERPSSRPAHVPPCGRKPAVQLALLHHLQIAFFDEAFEQGEGQARVDADRLPRRPRRQEEWIWTRPLLKRRAYSEQLLALLREEEGFQPRGLRSLKCCPD